MLDLHVVRQMTTISPVVSPRSSNDVSPSSSMDDAPSPSTSLSPHASESWQRIGSRGGTAVRSLDGGEIKKFPVQVGEEGKVGGSFDGQVEVAPSAKLTSKRRWCPCVPPAAQRTSVDR